MPNLTPKMPLVKDENGPGGFAMIDNYHGLVQQNLRNLLMTNPGERIANLQFGVGIKKFLFEQNTVSTKSEIKAKINQQVNKYMPFVSIESVDFSPDEEGFENYVEISIRYFLIPLSQEGTMNLTVENNAVLEG